MSVASAPDARRERRGPIRRALLRVGAVVLAAADRFARWPESHHDPELLRRRRTAVLVSWLGVVFTATTSVRHLTFGSTFSSIAMAVDCVLLCTAPWFIRRSRATTLDHVVHVFTTLTFVACTIVCVRTGGLASPAVVTFFLHPLTMYSISGRHAAVGWAVAAVAAIAGLHLASIADWLPSSDLTRTQAELLRASGFVGYVLASGSVLAGVEGVRAASQAALDQARRTLDRQRILGDMHDGVGGQLLGLIAQVRAGTMGDAELLSGLTTCLDELRLIVDSLDPVERPFGLAVGELRSRLEPRCEAAGVELRWSNALPPDAFGAEATLQILRSMQEMATNALRHSGCRVIDVTLAAVDAEGVERLDVGEARIMVTDDGSGIPAQRKLGRGLTSLESRAQRLGGRLMIESDVGCTRVAIVVPTASGRTPHLSSLSQPTRR